MKKLKLTDLQRHQLREAHRNALTVLNAIKANRLEGKALAAMKTLEASVQGIELFLAGK